MTAVTLQVQLPPDPRLSADRVAEITGRSQPARQIAWLKEHGWVFELDAQGNVLVGSLYAHLRLAGLNPSDANVPDLPAGFNLDAVR